jgi:hypothetical protein
MNEAKLEQLNEPGFKKLWSCACLPKSYEGRSAKMAVS